MSLNPIPVKKGRPVLLIVLLALVVAAMVMLSKCSHPAPQPPAIHPGLHKSGGDTLDVAIEISPMIYQPTADTITGIDYAIMTDIAHRMGRPVKFHPFAPLDYAINGLEQGYFDIIIASLPATAKLKERFSLTDEVYRDRQVLVQRRNDPHRIDSPDKLNDDTVWVAAGSPFKNRIENLAAENGAPIHIVELEGRTPEHLVMLVARGEIPRAVVFEQTARRMRDTRYPDLDIATPVSFTQFQTWAVAPRDTALVAALNRHLAALRATPAYRSLVTTN